MKIRSIKHASVPVLCAFLLFSCTPEIHFTIETPHVKADKRSLYIEDIVDERPQNEKDGYNVLYLKSISDKDYRKGFSAEFGKAVSGSFGRAFTMAKSRDEADLRLMITVRHFYGEYDRAVAATIWEIGSVVLLFIPRIITNFIPYDHFAGRAAMDLAFTDTKGATTVKSFDVLVKSRTNAYRRGSSHTAAQLSTASSKELNKIVREILASR